MTIKEYNSSSDVLVEFDNGFCKKTSYQRFRLGYVINNYYKNVVNGHGYLGESKSKERGKHKRSYTTWHSMLVRCYGETSLQKEPTYIGCKICEEWECYANFEKWYNENYYKIPNERICLDKDILVKCNKIYSPETCIFVPQHINNLFTKTNSKRGSYPIGVGYYPRYNKFCAYCTITDNKIKQRKTLGYYDSVEEAFSVYKNFKENHIKSIANEYKELIPSKLYDALMNYEVEITD
jgi:hypothetical protein